MATADTSIYGNMLRPVPTLMDNVNALDAADLQRTQLAGAKVNLIGQQQSLADQQAVRALYQRPGFDPSTPQGIADLSAASPATALATRKAMLDNAKTQADTTLAGSNSAKALAEAQKLKTQHAIDVQAQIAQAAGSATDQASWDRGLQIAQTLGADISQVPKVFDPVIAKQIHDQALTGAQQLDAHFKQLTADETVRHNQASEANTVRGQNVTAATARTGQVMENRRAGLDANGNFTGFDVPGLAPAASATPAVGAIPTTPGGGPPAPTMPAASGAQAAAKPASPIQGLVDGIGSYQTPESIALARTPPAMRGTILALVKAQYPDYSPMNYTEQQSGIRAFSPNGKSGQAVKSFNVGLAHLDTLSELAGKLNNGQIPVLNAAGNYVAQQSGGTAQTNFAAAKNIVTDEVVKAIVGGGGGVGDRDKAAATINAAQNPQQLQEAIGTVRTLMGGQLVGLAQSYRAATGKKDFRDKYLSPEAQRAYDALQQTSVPAAGGGIPPDIAAILAKHGGTK